MQLIQLADPQFYNDWRSWASALVDNLTTLFQSGDEQIGQVAEFLVALPDYGWLPATGGTFLAASYPVLAKKLGGTTLPTLTPQYVGTVVGIRAA